MKHIIFDIETAINFFYIYFYVIEDNIEFEFEISNRKQNIEELKKFLSDYVHDYFVSFNGLKYDAPLITFLIDKIKQNLLKNINQLLFNKSKGLIKNITKYPIKYFVHLDLAEIGGYNTKATSASLKLIEFNLRLNNIENIPFNPEEPIPTNKFDTVIYYCKNDVYATTMLFKSMDSVISIRKDPTYKDILNLPNTKLGETILMQELGLNTLYIEREEFNPINIKDVILPYIHFKIPIFRELKKWLENKIVDKPAGFFTNIPFEDLKSLEGYYIKETVKETQKNLNLWFNGIELVLGAGGLHASKKGIFESNSKRVIIDIDVNSYYPNIAIQNKLIPEQIRKFLISKGKKPEYFLEVYSGFGEKRKHYKKPHPLNTLYKLALNIIFGKSLQPSSIFGDLFYGMSTTINGQLSLLMLIENLYANISDIELIQVNTDGITLIIDREYREILNNIISDWEDLTHLHMEKVDYSKMIIANVNNYIAVKTDGKIKRKGKMFNYKDLEHNKDHSSLIVQKAINEFYINNIDYKKFIKEHTDIYDFCKRVRLSKDSKLVYRTNTSGIPFEQKYGKVTRYIVAKNGGNLVKILPPLKGKTENREELVEANNIILPLNHIDKTKKLFKYIDYQYYINEVEKIRMEIEIDFLRKRMHNIV